MSADRARRAAWMAARVDAVVDMDRDLREEEAPGTYLTKKEERCKPHRITLTAT